MICPRCNEEVVVGSICPVCGYVFTDDSSQQSSRDLTDGMETLLNEIKSLPDISLSTVFSNYMTWLLPLMAIGFLVMALVSEAGLFWILFVLAAIFAVWRLVAFVKQSKSGDGDGFNGLKNDLESILRIARRDYSKSSEMMRLVQDFENQLFGIAKAREAAKRRSRLISIIISVLIVAAVVLCVIGVKSLVS